LYITYLLINNYIDLPLQRLAQIFHIHSSFTPSIFCWRRRTLRKEAHDDCTVAILRHV